VFFLVARRFVLTDGGNASARGVFPWLHWTTSAKSFMSEYSSQWVQPQSSREPLVFIGTEQTFAVSSTTNHFLKEETVLLPTHSRSTWDKSLEISVSSCARCSS
jgi:hypothetical protein